MSPLASRDASKAVPACLRIRSLRAEWLMRREVQRTLDQVGTGQVRQAGPVHLSPPLQVPSHPVALNIAVPRLASVRERLEINAQGPVQSQWDAGGAVLEYLGVETPSRWCERLEGGPARTWERREAGAPARQQQSGCSMPTLMGLAVVRAQSGNT
jgi:hypothetical protein